VRRAGRSPGRPLHAVPCVPAPRHAVGSGRRAIARTVRRYRSWRAKRAPSRDDFHTPLGQRRRHTSRSPIRNVHAPVIAGTPPPAEGQDLRPWRARARRVPLLTVTRGQQRSLKSPAAQYPQLRLVLVKALIAARSSKLAVRESLPEMELARGRADQRSRRGSPVCDVLVTTLPVGPRTLTCEGHESTRDLSVAVTIRKGPRRDRLVRRLE
jgi:hypothetical protein